MRVLRSPGGAREVAGGMALGLFVSVLPLVGLQLPAALAAAVLLRRVAGVRLSPIAAGAGVWFTNPLTALPVYTATYLLGLPAARWLVPGPPEASAHPEMGAASFGFESLLSMDLGVQAVLALFVGGALLGAPLAWTGYRLTLRALARHRERIDARRQQRRSARPGPAPEPAPRALVPVMAPSQARTS